jgi:hypothetical protein
MYFYQIIFNDGRKVRRELVSKKIATAMYEAMSFEMLLLNVKTVEWGVMH